MFQKRSENAGSVEKLKNDIEKELVSSFRKKGINISGIQIVMEPDKMNLSVYISNPELLEMKM